jgi:hypothetical protein
MFVYGADEGIRTPDLRITNALLYQLSYISMSALLRGFVASATFIIYLVGEQKSTHFIKKSFNTDLVQPLALIAAAIVT